MKVRKCKCCHLPSITKKCFMKRYKDKNRCDAWRLWYDKKSQILCDSCVTAIELMIPITDSFDYEKFAKEIKKTEKKYTRPMRYQFWYLVNLGIINKFGEHQI